MIVITFICFYSFNYLIAQAFLIPKHQTLRARQNTSFLNTIFTKMTMEENTHKDLIRLGDADLLGHQNTYKALRKIKGVGFSFANAICNIANIPKNKKIGTLSDEDVKKIEDILKNPQNYNIKPFLLNRRKDRETGQDAHLIASNLKMAVEFDIKMMKMIKSYKGVRHAIGQPVRGQRPKAHFRKGSSLGVIKKKILPAK